MTASPLVQQINAASRAAWPEVKAALDVVDRTAREIAGIAEGAMPQIEQYISRSPDHAARKRRRVCEETVWALARLGYLRTGGERDVVVAARKVVAGWDDPDLDQFSLDDRETALVDTLKSLPDHPLED